MFFLIIFFIIYFKIELWNVSNFTTWRYLWGSWFGGSVNRAPYLSKTSTGARTVRLGQEGGYRYLLGVETEAAEKSGAWFWSSSWMVWNGGFDVDGFPSSWFNLLCLDCLLWPLCCPTVAASGPAAEEEERGVEQPPWRSSPISSALIMTSCAVHSV